MRSVVAEMSIPKLKEEINHLIFEHLIEMKFYDKCSRSKIVDVKSKFRKFDVNDIRKDFPILERKVNGKPLVYFDNAATTQNQMWLLIV